MISLKRLMLANDDDLLEAYRRTAVLLMQSIALHSVEGEAAEHQSFSATITELANGITDKTAAPDVLISAGAVSKTLQEYNRHTSQYIKAQSIELQTMIGMLTRTMSEISTSGDRSIGRLQEIEKKLAKTAMIDDLRTLKLRMSECLEAVREESVRQKEVTTQVVGDLKTGITKAAEQKSAMLEQNDDPVTGLPSRAHAEAELKRLAGTSARVYAGIFVVDRMQAINSRFGHAIGDHVMMFYLQRLTAALSAADKIFKWADSSYMAILERQEGLDNTRRELGQHLFQKWDRPFELGSRSVVLPISATWLLVEASGRSAAKTIAEIDGFVSKSVPTM
jgi:GGDEF domain-containing protein